MANQSIEARVRQTIVQTFNLPAQAINDDLRMSNPPAWDSLGHMALVVALEKELNVRFPGYLLPELTSVETIVREATKAGVA